MNVLLTTDINKLQILYVTITFWEFHQHFHCVSPDILLTQQTNNKTGSHAHLQQKDRLFKSETHTHTTSKGSGITFVFWTPRPPCPSISTFPSNIVILINQELFLFFLIFLYIWSSRAYPGRPCQKEQPLVPSAGVSSCFTEPHTSVCVWVWGGGAGESNAADKTFLLPFFQNCLEIKSRSVRAHISCCRL